MIAALGGMATILAASAAIGNGSTLETKAMSDEQMIRTGRKPSVDSPVERVPYTGMNRQQRRAMARGAV